MPQGTIKKLVADRGFGFIKGEQGELFFHRSEVQGVAFEVFMRARRWNTSWPGQEGALATSVRVV